MERATAFEPERMERATAFGYSAGSRSNSVFPLISIPDLMGLAVAVVLEVWQEVEEKEEDLEEEDHGSTHKCGSSAPYLGLWERNMAETQQVLNNSNEEESLEQETSRSRRRFKASNMSFKEMVEMADILKRADYDRKYGPYLNPNVRKAKIMTKVVKSLRRNFGVRRSKAQLRKRWLNLKLREQDQYGRIKKVLLKS
ncbi:hypothetical protein AB205_0013050 [Aquarana catesbeiana]|uniref:Uncharacterized protein n=1 Tax=Aquarana catesbeiana TaxID=8400 RepID=A0A2G9RWT1_AQUCT|nr:hypothetical protein AB205_0013050 [Aquarana catesbeiana]